MFTVVSGLMIWLILYSSKRKTKGKLTVWGLFKKFYGDIITIMTLAMALDIIIGLLVSVIIGIG